jgi:cell division protein FtsB
VRLADALREDLEALVVEYDKLVAENARLRTGIARLSHERDDYLLRRGS